MKQRFQLLGVALAIAGLTPLAHAVPEMRLFDGITTITIIDNLAGDMDSNSGRILWNGSIGNWTFSTDIGTSYPLIGTLTTPQLDMTFNAQSNSLGGTLVVSFTADGFGPSLGSAFASIGGTAPAGTVSYQTYGGTNNTLFSTSNLLTTQGPFSGPSFSGSVAGNTVNNAGTYALTQQVTITHAGSGLTTGDALLGVPDSGPSALLLGSGLTFLGFVVRRRPSFA